MRGLVGIERGIGAKVVVARWSSAPGWRMPNRRSSWLPPAARSAASDGNPDGHTRRVAFRLMHLDPGRLIPWHERRRPPDGGTHHRGRGVRRRGAEGLPPRSAVLPRLSILRRPRRMGQACREPTGAARWWARQPLSLSLSLRVLRGGLPPSPPQPCGSPSSRPRDARRSTGCFKPRATPRRSRPIVDRTTNSLAPAGPRPLRSTRTATSRTAPAGGSGLADAKAGATS